MDDKIKNPKIEKFKLPFTGYKQGEINSIVLVIEDISILKEADNEKGIEEKIVVENPKTKEQADEILVMLNATLKNYGFTIDAAGTKENMGKRLFNKNVSKLISKEDALSFCLQVLSNLEKSPGNLPTMSDLNEFLS